MCPLATRCTAAPFATHGTIQLPIAPRVKEGEAQARAAEVRASRAKAVTFADNLAIGPGSALAAVKAVLAEVGKAVVVAECKCAGG